PEPQQAPAPQKTPVAEQPVVKAPPAAEATPEPASGQPAAQAAAVKKEEVPVAPSASVHAGPAVRKLARQLGVDLAGVRGTGPRQRILQEDVHEWVKQRLTQSAATPAGVGGVPALPEIDFSRFGPVERVELNKLRRVAAANLHRSWLTIP